MMQTFFSSVSRQLLKTFSGTTLVTCIQHAKMSDTARCRGEFFSDSVFSDRVQCSESVFRVLVKKPIIMHIHENNVYWLGAMDQDADSVWAMTLNCLGHNNVYCQ